MERGTFRGIVAITRGGLIPAAIVARELECRLVESVSVVSYAEEAGTQAAPVVIKAPTAAGDGAGFLIVDDLVDSGETARVVRALLPEAVFACLYAKPAGREVADLWVAEVPQETWILFPWDTAPLFVPPLAKSAKPAAAARPAPGRLQAGTRVYAVGDIHGCLDRLEALHAKIAADLAAYPVGDSLLVHLGDYVDRGPASAGVIEALSGEVVPKVSRRVDLTGNHEMMMLEALRGRSPRGANLWLDNGGAETLASYGLGTAEPPAAWRAGIPEAHRLWLLQRDLTHREGNYLFVHAGIRPGVSVAAQVTADLLWIREPFLSDDEVRDVVVVHGHTPVESAEVRSNRIAVDTGAAMGGALTCVVLEGDRVRFLTA